MQMEKKQTRLHFHVLFCVHVFQKQMQTQNVIQNDMQTQKSKWKCKRVCFSICIPRPPRPLICLLASGDLQGRWNANSAFEFA
jgi:hypothetical protein